jgi:hypothetical protein
MRSITTATPTTRQLSGNNPDGRPILSVLLKRTLSIRPDGRFEIVRRQLPLYDVPQMDPKVPNQLIADCDLFPYKPATDLVILGHAYGHGRSTFEATVAVNGQTVKRLQVFGNRDVTATRAGGVAFSPPAAVDRVPLGYSHAYGGRDAAAEAAKGNPLEGMHKYVAYRAAEMTTASAFAYPRNPIGCGYLIESTRESVSAVRLPNLEDPLDLLTPQRLVVGSVGHWPRMPLPQSTGWVNYDWFPRVSCFGVVPTHLPMDSPFPELALGLLPADGVTLLSPTLVDAFRMTLGASSGLSLPYFRGGEEITLTNLSPIEEKLTIKLPTTRPKMWVDGRKGTLNETDPVIQTIVIEPDDKRVTVVWRGSAAALRLYMPQELEKMPFKVDWY